MKDSNEDKEKIDELRQENDKIIIDNINELKKIDSIFSDDYIKNTKSNESYIKIIGKLVFYRIIIKWYDNYLYNELIIKLAYLNKILKIFIYQIKCLKNLKDYTIPNKKDLLVKRKINFYYL